MTLLNLPKLSPRGSVIVHRVAQWTWACLAIPTLLWWRESILWVAFMSLYANFVGHASAAEAAEAKELHSNSGGAGTDGVGD
jgi:hypothetical protein